ncbi:hypothetical protein M378DRAFT_171942 [Amanita muscaria Koide BX008]|uniref:Uncharacterized protein n=1 Tax=Amanita muscaria (strain Koide BX008) TaxID=946122 RepID=A0A0C2S3M1_AMAMK|nr:hypothetical protein M378DRAFT_171942 [Amanita muscaria Koide BX008]
MSSSIAIRKAVKPVDQPTWSRTSRVLRASIGRRIYFTTRCSCACVLFSALRFFTPHELPIPTDNTGSTWGNSFLCQKGVIREHAHMSIRLI